MKYICFLCLIFLTNAFSMTGLYKGDKAPNFELRDTEGRQFIMKDQVKKTVLVFFRGSWCPYCIKQLQSINEEVIDKLDNDSTQLVAISVDKPIVAKKMKKKFNLKFTVLSDSKAQSLKAFKIVNKISDDLVSKYKSSYKIDVEADSGETHHMIAHPAVFIIEKGKVTFSDVQTDYKKRTKNSEILKALK